MNHPKTMALCAALALATLSAAPASAQSIPVIPPVFVGVPGGIVPLPPVISVFPGGFLPGGPALKSGRATVDFDRERSRERGTVVVR